VPDEENLNNFHIECDSSLSFWVNFLLYYNLAWVLVFFGFLFGLRISYKPKSKREEYVAVPNSPMLNDDFTFGDESPKSKGSL